MDKFAPLPVSLIFAIAALHWFGDFYMQSREEGNGKSKDNRLLTSHVAKYAFVMSIVTAAAIVTAPDFFHVKLCAFWLAFNAVLHWWTDYFTSRWTGRIWRQREHAIKLGLKRAADEAEHRFWSVIGLDQLIHAATLYTTAGLWLTS